MWTRFKFSQFSVFILILQAIFYCHGVNSNDEVISTPNDTTRGFLNPQWSKLWGDIVQSHHDDDSESNLKISRSKKRAADDPNFKEDRKDWYSKKSSL